MSSRRGLSITKFSRRLRQFLVQLDSRARRRPVFSSCILLLIILLSVYRIGLKRTDTGFDLLSSPSPSSSSSTSSRNGYTVVINTWKRYPLLKRTVAHYASCRRVDAIHAVWSEKDFPSHSLTADLLKLVNSNYFQASQKPPKFVFDVNMEDNLNNRFKPIKDLANDAIFSIDDDIIVPCRTLEFGFRVWQSAPDAMVGFVPRAHWLIKDKRNGVEYYNYGGWWSIWWSGTYSMVLSKAAFFHQKYLDLYTNKMHFSIREYVARERNCEDIAMSLLVSNATGASPIWVKGKIHEIGSSGISSLNGHNKRRTKCLNQFLSFYDTMPLLSTNFKAVDSQDEWFW